MFIFLSVAEELDQTLLQFSFYLPSASFNVKSPEFGSDSAIFY